MTVSKSARDVAEDEFNGETDGTIALSILGQLHIVTSFYANAGRHAGEVRTRLDGYLTPEEVAFLQKVMEEARHGGN